MGIGRSENMARIKSRHTRPERILRSALWGRGLRYRLHYKTPVGRPDVVFPRQKVAVFIDGCFWHGCPDHYVRPRSRADFWADKLRQNVERDCRQTHQLEMQGWLVVRVWEHEVFTDINGICNIIEQVVRTQVFRADTQWRVSRVEPLNEDGSQERRVHVALRDADRQRTVEQQRHTRKWKRPKKSGSGA